jgi:predicted DNA-binding transcriptional regulator YafY
MRRVDRLFQIVQYLRGGRLVTAETLAERLEVSKRTIYRDVADLIGSGVPIEGEAGVGYVMRLGYDVPPLMFTNAEISALVAGARMIRAWGGLEMAQAAEEALVKIDAVLPEKLRGIEASQNILSMPMAHMPEVLRWRLDAIEAATQNTRLLTLIYKDAAGQATERRVRPLSQVFWGHVWTLIAWCECAKISVCFGSIALRR